jgi:hypothetical protein
MDEYQILGVTPSSTVTEIVTAYRRRIRQVHPDLAPAASQDERRRRERATTELNLAYSAAVGRARLGAASAQEATTRRSPFARPSENTCQLCGTTPAKRYAVRMHSAWMASLFRSSRDIELCQECAATLRTNVDGSSLRSLPGLRALPRPRRRRVGVLAALAVVLVAVLVTAALVRSGSHSNPYAGECVEVSDNPRLVPCTPTNEARVESVESSPRACPAGDSTFTPEPRTVVCFRTPQ